MRITDVIVSEHQLLAEAMKKVATASGLNITADMTHLPLRMRQRMIGPITVMKMLDDLYLVADQIEEFDLGTQFWVYSDKYGISMGLKRYNAHSLTFKTVVNGRPYDGQKPVLELPQ
jgi:hypothetical protein